MPISAEKNLKDQDLDSLLRDLANQADKNYASSGLADIMLMFTPEMAISMAPIHSGFIGRIWNNIESAYSEFLTMWRKRIKHRHADPEFRETLQMLSAGNLLSLSVFGLGMTPLGPLLPIAASIGFAISIDDLIHNVRCKDNFRYWLKSNIDELARINNLLEKLNNNILTLNVAVSVVDDSSSDTLLRRIQVWVLNQQLNRREELLQAQARIQKEMIQRCAFRKYEAMKNNAEQSEKYRADLTALTAVLQDYYTETGDSHTVADYKMTEFVGFLNNLNSMQLEDKLDEMLNNESEFILVPEKFSRDSLANAEDQILENMDVTTNAMNSFFWGVILTGAVISCVPGAHIIGAGLLAVGVIFYWATNSKKISDFINTTFFGRSQTDDNSKNAEPIGELVFRTSSSETCMVY